MNATYWYYIKRSIRTSRQFSNGFCSLHHTLDWSDDGYCLDNIEA